MQDSLIGIQMVQSKQTDSRIYHAFQDIDGMVQPGHGRTRNGTVRIGKRPVAFDVMGRWLHHDNDN